MARKPSDREVTEYLEELLAALSSDDRGEFFVQLMNLLDAARENVLPDVETAVQDWQKREGI